MNYSGYLTDKDGNKYCSNWFGLYLTSENVNVLNNMKGFMPLVFGDNITLGDITIPLYSRGMLMTYNSNDAAVIAVSSTGVLYTVFRNNITWQNGKKWENIKTSFPTLLNGWTEYTSNANRIEKNNDIVTLTLSVKSGTGQEICQLPAGFRPKQYGYYPITNLTKREASVFTISAGGWIVLENPDVGNTVFANVSFIAEN